MVSLLNCENPNKQALENGYHVSSSGNMPKYKPRKSSAVRDFPRRCGLSVQSINSVTQQNAVPDGDNVGSAAEINCVKSETEVDIQSHEVMKSPVIVVANGTSANLELQENVVVPHFDAAAAVDEANGIATNTKIQIQSYELMKSADGMEIKKLGKPKNLIQEEDINVPHCNTVTAVEANGLKIENKVHILSNNDVAVLEESGDIIFTMKAEVNSGEVVGNPGDMKGEASLNDLVGSVASVVTHAIGYEVKEKVLDVKPLGIELSKALDINSMDLSKEVNAKEAQALVKELDNGEYVVDVKPLTEICPMVNGEFPVKGEAVPSPKHRRRVSANRDFPLYCGRNASPLILEEHLKMTSGTVSLVGIEKYNVKNEMETSKDAAECGASAKMSPGRVEGGSLVKAMVTGDERMIGNIEDAVISVDNEEGKGSVSKEIVPYAPDLTCDGRPLDNLCGSGHENKREIVNALMAAPYCPWSMDKVALSSYGGKTRGKVTWRQKSKAVAKKTNLKAYTPERSSTKKHSFSACKDADGTPVTQVDWYEDEYDAQHDGPPLDSPSGNHSHDIYVNVTPNGPSSSQGDSRKRVRETLRLFQVICRKLLQGEESKSMQSGKTKRIDYEAVRIMKERGKAVRPDKQYLGAVPGVEVGDEFQYRVELTLFGIHRQSQAGIDSMKDNGMLIATSIVASGAYADDMDNADVLVYSGQGGNVIGKGKEPEDQKLESGNLALYNSISRKNPVRVIRGFKESSESTDSKAKLVKHYVYDGLYTVENYWQETGPRGKLVFMFELRRIPGQPELAWKEVKKSKKLKVREGLCVDDIAEGKELLPICAVNTIDDEKPPPFNYIREMMYPDWFHQLPPKGCDCTGRCSDSRTCSCALRNGGEIPYNHNGAIVEIKALVYECGPSCKCPPSCYNRVSQHGIKIPLEIFKTEKRGWGVRSLTSISSGSFICEYAGELLEEKEAEERTGNDEYLFEIGNNYSDSSLNLDGQVNFSEAVKEGGYTIDAAKYGNVGRFINHSCSPNLYAQDVLYDHNDTRMPRVMLFAAENIPPLQELTYDYNYTLDQVHDSNGNIKRKSCFCGSPECTGRMY